MKKNDILNVDIIDTGSNGEGIAKVDNAVIFVPFALPGENVDVHILKVNKNIVFAKIEKIIKPSKIRIQAKCPYFTKCGGCEIQHIKYEEQLKIKTQIVKTALTKYAKLNCEVMPCVASEHEFYYRNKMQYPCSSNGIGMFAKHSHNLIDISSCPLSKPMCDKAYKIFRKFASTCKINYYNEKLHSGVLRNILFRENDNKICICLVINGKKLENVETLIDLYKQEFKDRFSLFYNINTKKSNTILSDKTICIYGQNELKQELFGITYYVSVNSFMQINDEVQNNIYSQVLKNILSNQTIINAYSGAGLLSAILAKNAKTVYGIEIVKSAHDNANKLSQDNHITNMQNICGDCAIELPRLMEKLQDKENTTLVLDPPRKGCEASIINAIINSKPNKIIYISCNPATLARDLCALTNIYNIKLVQPYDMFPQTRHVETLAILELKK